MDRYAFTQQDNVTVVSQARSPATPKADLPTTGELSLAIIEDPRNYDFSPDTSLVPQCVPLNATGPQIGIVISTNGTTATARPLLGAVNNVALPAPRYPTVIRAL
ncbi:hypothetical protein STCU_10574 [Strigomonas culicis]|uniref:Uncharacterized protein n=1 Tax=Strigomonas culicis TaxID=28005 RepID=S9THJ9_9TRYP|nr:hypothetical protein STCU_10574 [Strigomonas culicis]|eukprot:EPY17517.1 hypothetical protein STCU_10574 [Strigomonas culicis]